MSINNSFNILPWYDSLEKQSSKKWYAFGQSWPLLCPQGYILPFQFISDSAITIQSNIFAINKNTGNSVDLGVRPIVMAGTQIDASYYIIKMASTQVVTLPVGTYYLRFNTNLGYLYSEEITVIDDASECIKVQYWNEDTLYFMSGEINFADDFKFELYIRSTIGKPEYEFEEELTKRLGYKFIESQTSNKVYKFAFMAPEYICDAMRLIRLCDYVKLITKFDSYNALSFAYEPKWQEQGDLAAVDLEFDTDCIIQKLASFNRRLKESFYNALLADIDEPVLFSPDTVAQYYTEFKTTSFINGKLIRELTSILPTSIKESVADLVFPVDSLSDESREAKKMHLADLVTLIGGVELSKLFKGHYDESGNLLWIEALAHVGSAGDFISFIDNGTLDLPSIYDGLPIDGQTIKWEKIKDEDGNEVERLVAVGGGGTADKVTWDNIEGKPTWIGESKPSYSWSEITGKPSWIGSSKPSYSWTEIAGRPSLDFLPLTGGTLTGSLTMEGKGSYGSGGMIYFGDSNDYTNCYMGESSDDNFVIYCRDTLTLETSTSATVEGLINLNCKYVKVNGGILTYNSSQGYWELEGDLLITGGITSYE